MKPGTFNLIFEKEQEYWWYVGRLNTIRNLLTYLNVGDKNRILNLGCGTAGLVRGLSDFGEIHNLDIDENALRFCKERWPKNVIQADCLSLPFKEQTFDLVLALDILEHMEDDREVLKQIHGILKYKGYLIITVPSFKFMWSARDDIGCHKRRYNRAQILKKVEFSAFSLVKISYFNTLLFPIAFFEKQYMRLKKKTIEPDAFLPKIPAYLNKLFTMILSIEGKILKKYNLPFGLSLIAVCQKV
jgi:SAM-dependent methyltransferase